MTTKVSSPGKCDKGSRGIQMENAFRSAAAAGMAVVLLLGVASQSSAGESAGRVSASGKRALDGSLGTGRTDGSLGTGRSDGSLGTGRTAYGSLGTGRTDGSLGTGRTYVRIFRSLPEP